MFQHKQYPSYIKALSMIRLLLLVFRLCSLWGLCWPGYLVQQSTFSCIVHFEFYGTAVLHPYLPHPCGQASAFSSYCLELQLDFWNFVAVWYFLLHINMIKLYQWLSFDPFKMNILLIFLDYKNKIALLENIQTVQESTEVNNKKDPRITLVVR